MGFYRNESNNSSEYEYEDNDGCGQCDICLEYSRDKDLFGYESALVQGLDNASGQACRDCLYSYNNKVFNPYLPRYENELYLVGCVLFDEESARDFLASAKSSKQVHTNVDHVFSPIEQVLAALEELLS